MRKKDIEIFSESLKRCTENPLFMDRFYDTFIAESDEITEKFKNTDMDKQKQILLLSLANMVIAYDRPAVLSDIAIKHDAQHLDIKPRFYLSWLDCLVEAVRKTDPLFSVEIEKAWRVILQNGINYMINQYNSSI